MLLAQLWMRTPSGTASVMPIKTVRLKTNHSISLSKTAHGAGGPEHQAGTGVRIFDTLKRSRATAQVFRLKAEGYKTSRRARIKPFKTFSVSTTFGSIANSNARGLV
jgi:hypothetical protein